MIPMMEGPPSLACSVPGSTAGAKGLEEGAPPPPPPTGDPTATGGGGGGTATGSPCMSGTEIPIGSCALYASMEMLPVCCAMEMSSRARMKDSKSR